MDKQWMMSDKQYASLTQYMFEWSKFSLWHSQVRMSGHVIVGNTLETNIELLMLIEYSYKLPDFISGFEKPIEG